jgi:hypothetical protein
MKESSVTKAVREYLTSLDCWFWKVSDRYTSGIPDIVGVYRGRFFGLELKRPGGARRKLQDHNLRKIRDAGGVAGIARSVADVKRILEVKDE